MRAAYHADSALQAEAQLSALARLLEPAPWDGGRQGHRPHGKLAAMKSDGHDGMLIVPVRREMWRPFYAFGAMAFAAALVGLPATLGGSSVAGDVVLFVAVLCLGLACVRTLIWWLLPGRVTVSYDDSGLFVRRGARLLCHYPWSGVERIFVTWGARWPEWDRSALLIRIDVVLHGEQGTRVESSPGLLLVRPRDIERAARKLEAVVNRYVGNQRWINDSQPGSAQ